jgi:ribosome maturation factor RimP
MAASKQVETVTQDLETKERKAVEGIWSLVGPVIESEGLELVEVEYRRESPGWVLRLFIDREDGVTVEDCARVSRVVGDVLDVTDPIANPYHLEISSPGLNRPLRLPEHYQKELGKIIEVRTTSSVENRRNFKGTLSAVTHDGITLECDGRRYEIPFRAIERARLLFFESRKT